MDEVVNIYKPQGLTPLQLIEQFRQSDPKYTGVKIGYAGRLDPLAHGVMILTIGEANKKRDPYLKVNKSYRFSVLFGLETDSYDYLGILHSVNIRAVPPDMKQKIEDFIQQKVGKFSQHYPPFSSKPVNGIPLYKLAKANKIPKESMPTKEVEIYGFKLTGVEIMQLPEVKKTILGNLRKIRGHFRQKRIISIWNNFFKDNPECEFMIANFEIDCSSGTYVRSLASEMGRKFGCGAMAFEILRTAAGGMTLEDSLRID